MLRQIHLSGAISYVMLGISRRRGWSHKLTRLTLLGRYRDVIMRCKTNSFLSRLTTLERNTSGVSVRPSVRHTLVLSQN